MKKEIAAPSNSDTGKAMEGRFITKKGVDMGDRQFHEHAWGTDDAASVKDLERISGTEEDLALAQAETFARINTSRGIAAFEDLLCLYPKSRRTESWKERIVEIKRTAAL